MAGFESESRLVKLGEMGLDTNGEVPRQTISKIYENSFLLPLTTLVMPAGVNHSDWDRRHNQKAREIVDKKIRLLTEIIPAAWYDGNLALHNFTSPRLQAKINDPGNMDHGASHLNRYGNNFRALLPYTTDVVNLPVNDLRDFVIAGEMGVLHDHAEIDALREESSLDNIKEVHAHLGAVNAAGVVRAMRLQGVAIDERVEKLVFMQFIIILIHSGMASIKKEKCLFRACWKDIQMLLDTFHYWKRLKGY